MLLYMITCLGLREDTLRSVLFSNRQLLSTSWGQSRAIGNQKVPCKLSKTGSNGLSYSAVLIVNHSNDYRDTIILRVILTHIH